MSTSSIRLREHCRMNTKANGFGRSGMMLPLPSATHTCSAYQYKIYTRSNNSHTFCLPVQDLYKIKPDKNSSKEHGGDPKIPSIAEELLAVDAYYRKKITSL